MTLFFGWIYSFLSVLLIFDRTIMDIVSFYKDFTKDIANITKLEICG